MTDNNQNIWKLVLNKTNIIDVISEYCNLIKSGRNYKTNCPFHQEKTSSFIVSPDKQIFTCFGCRKSGNAIKFLEYKLNLSPIEGLRYLAKRLNIDISQLDRFQKDVSEEQTQLFEATEAANNYFQYQFHNNRNNNVYLEKVIKQRQISDEILTHFKLGFSPKDISAFEYLNNKGFEELALSKISISSANNLKLNFFNNRLMFPIYDENLNCVGFSGRALDGDSVKYLNTSENAIFKKNSLFFNWNNVKNNLVNDRDVFLVEGQFDVIALYRVKVLNALAVMGTALTEHHLALLKNCTINLFFDGDKAGRNATIKNLKIILANLDKYNLKVNIVQNNTTYDPDELYFLKNNGEFLKRTINNKIPYLDYIYNITFNTPEYDTSLEKRSELLQEFQHFLELLSTNEQNILKDKATSENKLSNDFVSVSNDFKLLKNIPQRKFNNVRVPKGSKSYNYYSIIKTLLKQPYYLITLLEKNEKDLQRKHKFINALFVSTTRNNKKNPEKEIIKNMVEYIKNNPNINQLKLDTFIANDQQIQEVFQKKLDYVEEIKNDEELYNIITKDE